MLYAIICYNMLYAIICYNIMLYACMKLPLIAKTDYPDLAKSLIAFKMASLKLGLLWQA